jgi:circadian clock protein KaiC
VQQFRRASSGIQGLDRVLNGGFIEGASYIVQGRPGAGKTILSNQIAFAHAAGGGNVLYVTLLSETHERLFQALSTLDFFDAEKLGQEIIYVSVFQTLRDEGLGAVVNLLRSETRRHNATLLVFDGLLNARDRADTDLDVKTFVAEVQDQAAFVGCTVLLLTSTRLEDNSPEHTMVDGVIDLRVDLVGVRTVRQLQVRKSRGSAAFGGLHQYEITRAGVTVYPRLEVALAYPDTMEAPARKRLSTGCPGIDRLIQGGLPEGSVTLLAGPTGTGKTTLGLHFLSLASREEPALHFGFFETPARLQMKATLLGIPLPAESSGVFEIVWNPLAENLLDKLAYQLLEHVAAHNVRRLFIDGLGGFERAATHPPRLVEFFATLANQLRGLGVTTVMTRELREIPSPGVIAPMPEMSAIIDNLLLLRQVEKDCAFQLTVAVEKMRDSAVDKVVHRLDFTSKGLKVGARFSNRVQSSAVPERSGGL